MRVTEGELNVGAPMAIVSPSVLTARSAPKLDPVGPVISAPNCFHSDVIASHSYVLTVSSEKSPTAQMYPSLDIQTLFPESSWPSNSVSYTM